MNKETRDLLYTTRWAIKNDHKDLALEKISEALGETKPVKRTPSGEKPKLAVVVGHTKRAGGAWAKAPISKNEYDFNTEIAELMKKYADEYGIEVVVITRDKGGLRGAYQRVREWFGKKYEVYDEVNNLEGENNCSIELHFNAATPAATGTETLYDNDPKINKTFAKMINDEMVNTLRLRDRGIKLRVRGNRGHYNLHLCEYPSCIVEPFFGSNKNDCARAFDKKEDYAKSLVRGAAKFLEKY